ncbi:hypothetical protein H5410_012934, partial [Solanum commersonii]
LIPTAIPAHFKGQTNPRTGKPPILPIFVCDVHGFFDLSYGASWFRRPNRPIFKVKRALEQNSDMTFAKTNSWTSVKSLVMEAVGPNGQIGPFSRSNESQSSYGVSWSRRPNQPVFKVKRALEQLWSQLVPMAKPTHFQGQTSLEKVNRLFCQFSCIIIHGFFSDPNFDVNFAKNFHGHPLRP